MSKSWFQSPLAALFLMAAFYSGPTFADTSALELIYGKGYRLQSTGRGDKDCLAKFVQPFRLQAGEAFPPELTNQIEQLQKELSGLLPGTISMDAKHAVFYRVDKTKVARSGDPYKAWCSASRRENHACEIEAAFVTLPSGLDAGQTQYCLLHETLHGLGFRGHVWDKNSVMNPAQTRNHYSEWDTRQLQFLYSDQVLAGMSPAQAKRLLQQHP